jgi:hypothetical protein
VAGDRALSRLQGAPAFLGVAGACAVGAALAIGLGINPVAAATAAIGVAALGVIVVKVRADVATSRLVTAVALGEIAAAEAPDHIQARLESRQHRARLAGAIRRSAKDAARRPRPRLITARPLVLHFEAETRARLVELADLLDGDGDLPRRGVAMAERLVTEPTSPLFGESDADLERALGRVLVQLKETRWDS